MPICRQCHAEAPLGSGYCPRCGAAIDDGLGRRQMYRRVVVAIAVGVAALSLIGAFFVAHRSPVRVEPAPPASPEVRKL